MLQTLVCAIDILLWTPVFWFAAAGLLGFGSYSLAMKLRHGAAYSLIDDFMREGFELGDSTRLPSAQVAVFVLALAIPVLIFGTDFSTCGAKT